ncbi:hypothetical protein [Brotaphodocola sp.]|uniref:hypothetical protein n=1 Tax=Brotaphodocola sp. TaxID=3073577 RepID=UPI003D7DEB47
MQKKEKSFWWFLRKIHPENSENSEKYRKKNGIFVNEYVRKFKKIRGVGKHFILYNEVEYERILTYICLICMGKYMTNHITQSGCPPPIEEGVSQTHVRESL